MKQIILKTLTMAIVIYLCFAFILLEIDFREWSNDARFFYMFPVVIFSGAFIAFEIFKNE